MVLNKLSGLFPRPETFVDAMVAVQRVDDGNRSAPSRVNHELGVLRPLARWTGRPRASARA